MKIVPTAGRVVVTEVEAKEMKTVSGLILNTEEAVSDEIMQCRIEETSDKDKAPEGVIAYVSRYSCLPIKDTKTSITYYIVPITDILAYEGDEEAYVSK